MTTRHCPGFQGVCEEQNTVPYGGYGKPPYCDTCKQKAEARQKRLARERRRQNPEYIRCYMQDWRARHPGYATKQKQRQRENNPEAHRTRYTAYNALVAGKIKRPKFCEWGNCAEPPAMMHHDDYSKPLEVKHYCRKHHMAADRLRRRREGATV